MNIATATAILDFEVYLLMTMKLRMVSEEESKLLEAKLAEHGFSVVDAQRVHERVAKALGDEASYFGNMQKLLSIADQNATSLGYSSALWPGFDFNAIANEEGLLESARYRHTRRDSSTADSPIQLPVWSVDVTEFTERFGPMTGGHQWSLFDKLLPAHEEYEFVWNGEHYGAAFSWGLFLWVTKLWPAD